MAFDSFGTVRVTGTVALPISIAMCSSRLCASIPTYVITSSMTGSSRLRL